MPASDTSACLSAASSLKATFRNCSTWASPASSGRERRFRTSSPFCKSAAEQPMLDDLLQRFHHHDRLALSRLVSLVAQGEQIAGILNDVGAPAKPARVVAVTGSGGVGKSTLIGKLIEEIR